MCGLPNFPSRSLLYANQIHLAEPVHVLFGPLLISLLSAP